MFIIVRLRHSNYSHEWWQTSVAQAPYMVRVHTRLGSTMRPCQKFKKIKNKTIKQTKHTANHSEGR